jgi:hypothetical protein
MYRTYVEYDSTSFPVIDKIEYEIWTYSQLNTTNCLVSKWTHGFFYAGVDTTLLGFLSTGHASQGSYSHVTKYYNKLVAHVNFILDMS